MRTGNHHSLSGATAASAGLSDDAMGCLDGTIIEPDIRCLGPQDENEFCRILLGIEPSDRCSRFGQFVSDAYLSGHAQSALANADWIAGAFVDDRLRGVVEVYRDRSHGWAQAAFVVEQEWRRRGLGWAFLRKLAAKANGRFDIVLGEIFVDVAVANQIG
jgi:GNAT superfamily N-acetyltransferase